MDCDYQGKITSKMCCVVKTNVADPDTAKWQMNQATNNWCLANFGEDTKGWIGKDIEINLRQVGNMNPSVYPVLCSLEKVIS